MTEDLFNKKDIYFPSYSGNNDNLITLLNIEFIQEVYFELFVFFCCSSLLFPFSKIYLIYQD